MTRKEFNDSCNEFFNFLKKVEGYGPCLCFEHEKFYIKIYGTYFKVFFRILFYCETDETYPNNYSSIEYDDYEVFFDELIIFKELYLSKYLN